MPDSETTVPKSTTENEIGSIDLIRLNNGAHFQFVKNVHQKLVLETTILTNPIAKDAADKLGKALEEEDRCYVISQKSLLTKRIVEADHQRDQMFMGYRAAVNAFLRSPDTGMAEASERLWAHLTDYRISTGWQFDRETAAIANLLKDCETKYAADVDKLGVKAYVDALKTANEKVDELLLTRTTDRGEQAAGALRTARRASDAAYLWLARVVNSLVVLDNGTAKCDAFIDYMNVVIKRYKEQVLTSKKHTDDTPDKPKEPKKPADPKEPKDPKKPADPKDPKKPDAPKQPDEKPKPGGGDSGNPDITLPEE